jgi:hypothetical protein
MSNAIGTQFLQGVLLSGLRLQEAVVLSWDSITPFSVDLSGRYPRFRIRGDAQKSGQNRLLPMVPEAAAFFLATPEDRRRGRVFRLDGAQHGEPISTHSVGQIVARIGKRSGVIVDPRQGKTATIHDLRRTFATKWSRRVAPATLMQLCHHSSIQTTMSYYVDQDCDETTSQLWMDHPPTDSNTPAAGNIFGDIYPQRSENEESPETVTDCRALSYASEGDGNRTRNHRIDSLQIGLHRSAQHYSNALKLLDLRFLEVEPGSPKVTLVW